MCTDSHPGGERQAAGLYVVATPIGNRADLSARARDLIETADVVAAEDTRSIARLLGRPRSAGTSVSLTEHNVEARIPGLLAAARSGAVVLVSDAGTPAIADPGTRLVAAAHDADVRVVSVPGPSALATALSVSGFEVVPAVFLGFLPRKAGDRKHALMTAVRPGGTVVFFESPRRLQSALEEVSATLGDPLVVVCRELSKLHEEIVRGRAADLASQFAEARGECTVVVRCDQASASHDGPGPREVLGAMKRAGARQAAAAGEVARLFALKRSDVYALWDQA